VGEPSWSADRAAPPRRSCLGSFFSCAAGMMAGWKTFMKAAAFCQKRRRLTAFLASRKTRRDCIFCRPHPEFSHERTIGGGLLFEYYPGQPPGDAAPGFGLSRSSIGLVGGFTDRLRTRKTSYRPGGDLTGRRRAARSQSVARQSRHHAYTGPGFLRAARQDVFGGGAGSRGVAPGLQRVRPRATPDAAGPGPRSELNSL